MNQWLELFRANDFLGVKKHIKSGGDLQAVNETGEGILACALREHCESDLVLLLIESGADIFDFDEQGVSVLDMAITYNSIEIVEYLIEHGVDINKTQRRSGFTPLMAAACYGRTEIVKILIQNGVVQDAVDLKGFSALDFARKMNKKSVLHLLKYDENNPENRGYAR